MNVVIATRQSPLALWQAEHVRARLSALAPGASVELLGMTTEGDRRLGVPAQSSVEDRAGARFDVRNTGGGGRALAP